MKTFFALLMMVGVAACGGNTTVEPDGGTGGTAPVPCTDCVAQTVTWGPNGGLVVYTESSSLSACRTFKHIRIPSGSPDPSKECSVEIGGCNAGPVAVHEVEQALADPDVVAALAGSTPLYGTDPRPCDGTVLEITVGDHSLLVGGDCATSMSCTGSQSCVPIPAGVNALADVLHQLEQASLKLGTCAQTFP